MGVGPCSHEKQTASMLEEIKEIIIKEKPNGLLAYGGTISTIAGVSAASKLYIQVYHTEAGRSTLNKLTLGYIIES